MTRRYFPFRPAERRPGNNHLLVIGRPTPEEAAAIAALPEPGFQYPCVITAGSWGSWGSQQATSAIAVGSISTSPEDYSELMVLPNGNVIVFYRSAADSDLYMATLNPLNVLSESLIWASGSSDVDERIYGPACNAAGVHGCTWNAYNGSTFDLYSWTSAAGVQQIATGLDWFDSDIDIDAAGKAHVAARLGSGGIYYSYDGGTLAAVGMSSTFAHRPRIAIDGLGTVHLVSNNRYIYSTDNGTSWSSPPIILPWDSPEQLSSICATKTGVVVFGAISADGGGLGQSIMYTNDNGATFSAPFKPFGVNSGDTTWNNVPPIQSDWNSCRVYIASKRNYVNDPPEMHVMATQADNTLTDVETVEIGPGGENGYFFAGADENCTIVACRLEEATVGFDIVLKLSRRERADVCVTVPP